MKSFSDIENPIDIEDLTKMKCIDQNKNDEMIILSNNKSKWYSPNTIYELNSILNDCSLNNLKYKLIAGNTSKGIYKDVIPDLIFIDIKNIKEFYEIKQNENILTIGSNITLSALIQLFKTKSQNQKGFEYLSELSNLITKVANTTVRNIGTWSGNLNMKRENPSFPSDLFIAFKTVDALLTLKTSNNQEIKVNLDQFLDMDMKNKFISSIEFKAFDKNEYFIKIFKVMPRSQMSHYYVTAGFLLPIERGTLIVNGEAKFIYGGISSPYFKSSSCSSLLLGKDFRSKQVFLEACKQLDFELENTNPFHKQLSLNLFYKFVLSICPSLTNDRLLSAIESIHDLREVSSGQQKYPINPDLYPLTQPIPKISSYAQTTGESVFNSDIPKQSGQLEGAFILTSACNCFIQSIDFEDALNAPGVKKIVFGKDIPNKNNIFPLGDLVPGAVEELFAEDFVSFTGQPIGLVVAETFREANYAASLVKVTYKDIKKPILTIDEALEANSFHAKIYADLVVGNVDEAIQNSANKLSGDLRSAGQYHFYLENLIAISTPTEDGFDIDCGGQWLDYVQKAVGQVVNVKNLADIEVKTKNIGGGFGGKATRAALVACAAAVASAIVLRPVRVALDLNTNMRLGAKRFPQLLKYNVGFDDTGKINGVKVNWYSDAGYLPFDNFLELGPPFFDNCYSIPNWHIEPNLIKTNTPLNTSMRAPFTLPAITLIESVLDHVALFLKKDPLEIKLLNMYKKDDITHIGLKVPYFNLDSLLASLIKSCDYEDRKSKIDDFNKNNRWKKRGISIMPMKYGAILNFQFYSTMVTIFNGDGSVLITHGGIEIGQGINTKVAQVCAHELGIPLEKIIVKSMNNSISANSQWTGGSVTTEIVAKGIIECCKRINENLESIRKLMPENYNWKELIAKAFLMNVDISARHFVTKDKNDVDFIKYDIYAAACTEVLIDVLTGDKEITRTDILYDCGQP
jgi:xanthine dehydrogenase/oxidase